MFYQNDLREDISHIACYFCSIAFYAEKYQETIWTAEQLNKIFDRCKELGYIDKNLCIYSPSDVTKLLGCRIKYIGKFYPKDFSKGEIEVNRYVIGCWKLTPEAEQAHFCVMDNSGIYTKEHILFDPWKGGSRTASIGLCSSLRVFQRI